jgi:hypothetical protein
MRKRQAQKIIKCGATFCSRHFNGPETIQTGGVLKYPQHQYLAALRKVFKVLARK